jgi:Flp pilus assembly protein TadG
MLAFVAVVPLVAAFGGIAVDCMHYNDATSELQRTTDAAALAGAEDLNKYVGGKNMTGTTVSATNEEPVNFAIQVASLNAVDGPVGLWSSSSRTVTATILHDNNFGGPAGFPNRCNVTGTISIRSLFAKIFGNFHNTVTTSSSAGLSGLTTLYGGFAPLLVSWVDDDIDSKKLKDQLYGSTYTVNIKNNAFSNSVWILNNNTTDEYAINHIYDPVKYPGNVIPPVSIGDYIKSDNGEKSAGKLFDELKGKDIGLIITDDSLKNYLAKGQPVHKVIGFIGMKVTSFDDSPGKDGYSFTGTLEPLPIAGGYDPNGTPSGVGSGFSAYKVRLIQ